MWKEYEHPRDDEGKFTTKQNAVHNREKKEAGKLLGVNLSEYSKKDHQKLSYLIKTNKLPDGITPEQGVGGTMDLNGNLINMRDFENGYLVSCGNDSYPENREFLINNSDFIKKFLEYSSDGKLYVGSWFENNKNTNEPTIWVEDKETAIELAKKLRQYQITNCEFYNKYNCENYKLLNSEQGLHYEEIFTIIYKNEEEHKLKLSEVKL